MAELGRRGGKIGGKNRAASMTSDRRREIALKAARSSGTSLPVGCPFSDRNAPSFGLTISWAAVRAQSAAVTDGVLCSPSACAIFPELNISPGLEFSRLSTRPFQ